MKQIVEEYWSFDGSIEEVIRMFLKSNPNYKVAHLQLATTQQHGVYALVVYEYYEVNNQEEINEYREVVEDE